MAEEKKQPDLEAAAPQPEAEQPKQPEQKAEPKTEMEQFYEHFRKVPLRYLDVFIAICMGGLLLDIVVGILKAKGIL